MRLASSSKQMKTLCGDDCVVTDLEREQILPPGMSPKDISLSEEKELSLRKPSHVSDLES